MLKLLIADDERIIRETISNLIDWKSLGVELIGLCSNGLEAYDMIIDESPDIVLTDIKMPGMNGLELIKNIAEINPDTHFIILSGYGEFEYAKEAMKFGIRHYILKPCNEKQISESIAAVSQECLKQRLSRGTAHSYAQKKQEQEPSCPPVPANLMPNKNTLSEQIMTYVEQHLSDPNITLKALAENHLFMNVDYVSKRFLKETGRKFSDYLAETRIRSAKKYLAEGYRVQDVADKVGCGNNPHYFSQLFKKKTGATPSAYAAKHTCQP